MVIALAEEAENREMQIDKNFSIKWRVLLLVFSLQILTVTILKNTERFCVDRQQLLADPEFVKIDDSWTQDGNGTTRHGDKKITVVNSEKTYHAVFQEFSIERAGYYQASFDAATENISLSGEGQGGAEVFFIYRTAGGERNGSGRKLFSAYGTRDMHSYVRTVYIGEEVGSVDFSVRINSASGELTIANPVVSQLQESSFFKKTKASLVVLWVFIWASFAFTAVRYLPRVHLVLLGATLSIALLGVLLPEKFMSSLYGYIIAVIPTTLVKMFGVILESVFGYSLVEGKVVGKLGHFLVFTIVGVVTGVNSHRIGALFALAMLATFAFFTEAMQLLVVGRTPLASDFAIDIVAAIIGLLVGLLIYSGANAYSSTSQAT